MLSLHVNITPGVHPRVVHLVARTDPAAVVPDPDGAPLALPADAIVPRFLRAVAAGCFTLGGPASAPVVLASSGGAREMWDVSFPALPSGAFGVPVALGRASFDLGSGLVELSLVEDADPSAPRLAADTLEPMPPFAPPFPIDFGPGVGDKEITVLVSFVDPVTQTGFDRTHELFEGWGGVLYGGFRSDAGYPFSTGFVTDVVRHLPNEVVVTLRFADAACHGWDALGRGLAAIHLQAPVARADIG